MALLGKLFYTFSLAFHVLDSYPVGHKLFLSTETSFRNGGLNLVCFSLDCPAQEPKPGCTQTQVAGSLVQRKRVRRCSQVYSGSSPDSALTGRGMGQVLVLPGPLRIVQENVGGAQRPLGAMSTSLLKRTAGFRVFSKGETAGPFDWMGAVSVFNLVWVGVARDSYTHVRHPKGLISH